MVFVSCRTRSLAYAEDVALVRCSLELRSDRAFSKNRMVPRYLRARDLAFELLVERQCIADPLRLAGSGRGTSLHRCRSGLRHENERKQANE